MRAFSRGARVIGMGMGAEGDIIAYSLSRYFGLKAFGTAYGYAFGSFVLAGAVGTLLMGACFDLTHAYSVPLAGFFIAMLLAACLMARLGPYRCASYGCARGTRALPGPFDRGQCRDIYELISKGQN